MTFTDHLLCNLETTTLIKKKQVATACDVTVP